MRKAINHLKSADPVIAALLDRIGPYRIQYREPVFETLVRSIVFQQLNGRAALTIFQRFADACGNGGVTPQTVLKMRIPRMRSAGLSPQKATYIRDLARRTHKGEIDFEALPALPDEEILARLLPVKGVGVWTVQMFLIFALRRRDVLPTADLGIRAAMQRAYQLPALPKPPEMEQLAAAWRPFRTIACWYLWRSLDNQAGI